MTNLFTETSTKPMTAPVNSTATVTSSAVDVSGYTGSKFHVYYGDSADTLAADLCWTAKLTECATESGTYTDVAVGDVIGADANSFGLVNAPTEDQKIYSLGYQGTCDFVKVVVTATGTHSSGTPIAIFCELGLPRSQTTDYDVNP